MKRDQIFLATGLIFLVGTSIIKLSVNNQPADEFVTQNVSSSASFGQKNYQQCMTGTGTPAILRGHVQNKGGNSEGFCRCLGIAIESYYNTHGGFPADGWNDRKFADAVGRPCLIKAIL